MKIGTRARALLCTLLAANPMALARTPDTAGTGARTLRFEFPGLRVGIAEYEEGPTGCTVFLFPDRAMVTADVRGGSPGTTGTDAVRLGHDAGFVDAIVFAGGVSGNTTITLLHVNQKTSYADLQRLAVQTHTSMARAIQPFQTRNDGDVLFAASTGEVENPETHFDDLAVVAGELAWDAVLASYDPR